MKEAKDIYHQLLLEQISGIITAHSDKTAYTLGKETVSYAEMDSMANSIATAIVHFLACTSEESEHPVRIGINLPRNSHFVSCIWAAIKLGACYVPIDIATPDERKAFICGDADIDFLINTDNIQSLISTPPMEELPVLCKEMSEAYLIYTSGTTGKPKGVSQSYRTLYSYMQTVCLPDNFNISSSSVVLQFASINFDVSVIEIFSSLCYGGKLVIAQDHERLDAKQLYWMMKRERITYCFLPPSLMAVFPDFDFPDMDTLSAGGEAIPHSLTKKIAGKYPYRFVNGYGPTESIVTTTHEIENEDDWQNIGKAVPGVVCYVADETGRLVNPGEEGELLIGGMQLTNGYWNRPELNSKMFFDNPYEKVHEGIDVSRLYHSGDLVTLNEDGSFNYIGRKDSQIKLHGFRIELSGICTRIENHKRVRRAYVRLETLGNDNYIVAYILTEDGNKDIEDIKQYVSKHLTPYMIPTFWNVVDDFKLNINGKIDKNSLVNEAWMQIQENDEELSSRQNTIMSVVSNVAGVRSLNIDVDLIHDLGLSSLKLMQIPADLELLGIYITVNEIQEYRTIRGIAENATGALSYWYNADAVSPDKPTLIVISGYTSFSFLYKRWAERVNDMYNIFVVESYHNILDGDTSSIDEITAIYEQLTAEVAANYNVVAYVGFCLGGEQAMYLAHKRYHDSEHKPTIVVIDGELKRDKDPDHFIPLNWPFFSQKENNRRRDIDLALIITMPDFVYEGHVVSFLSGDFCEIQTITPDEQTTISEENMNYYREYFERTPRYWKEVYPDCDLIIIPETQHLFSMLVNDISVDMISSYFLEELPKQF